MLQHSSTTRASLDRVFHALSDPARRRMIERLATAPASVSELGAPFDMTLAAIVQHVQVLEASGVVRTEKVGRVRMCRLEPDVLSAAERWFRERRDLWEHRFDLLEEVLRQPAADAPAKHAETKKKKRKRNR